MQYIPEELLRVLSSRLKLGERQRPNVRVEVDRLAFIPGRTEEFTFVVAQEREKVMVQKVWVPEAADGSYEGSASLNVYDFVFPLQGYNVDNAPFTDYFGTRGGKHRGVDIAVPVGTPVLASWAGKVVKVYRNPYTGPGYGVVIKHAEGVMTKYFHLSEINVDVGDEVFQGQVIGLSGNTGNVRSGGKPVTGSYSDPNSPRARGLGAHLHFEIWVGVDEDSVDGTGGKPVDPIPYMRGTKKMYTGYTIEGNKIDEGTVEGYLGEVKLHEKFDKRDWYKSSSKYSSLTGFVSFYKHERGWELYDSGGKAVFQFPAKEGAPAVASFAINVKSLKLSSDAIMSIGFGSDFDASEGDLFEIFVDNKPAIVFKNFAKYHKNLQEIKKIVIPEETKYVTIKMKWGGKPRTQIFWAPTKVVKTGKKFVLDYIKIQELLPYPPMNMKSERRVDPTKEGQKGHWETVNLGKFVYNELVEKKTELHVGQFVYMDTLVLPNVQSVEIDNYFDQEAAELRVVISNPGGYFSPDFNPYYFPELAMTKSPWSYMINGHHVGVLSENTPIRVYMGYGHNLMRVFTGLIDKVDIETESATLTIYARDMYKKIIEKVITEKKAYPDVEVDDDVPDSSYQPNDPNYSISRRDLIIRTAKEQAAKWGVDYKFLLAIAQHETGMGTLGMGRQEKGDFILGYGCYGPGQCDPDYQGLEKQFYYGAKRMAEALASRGKQVKSYDDVVYFHAGGDKGPAYTWSQDSPNWEQKVWKYYQEILANPAKWDESTSTDAKLQNTKEKNDEEEKVMWLKSAVVQDLIAHAGMFGWRQNPDDLQYPDAVIEETYLIEANQKTGKVVKAVPDKEGEFTIEEIESHPTPFGWLNPFVEAYGKTFEPYTMKVSEAINEVIKDTGMRAYCDRYGTFRLESIDFNKPIVAKFDENENLITINKTIDWSRGRSHIVVADANGNTANFVDKEILLELKGEIRTAYVVVPWAKTLEAKRAVAERLFWDMKRYARTLQVSIPGNPALELLDRVMVRDKTTATANVYIIKGIRTQFSVDTGYIQIIDLMWSEEGTVV